MDDENPFRAEPEEGPLSVLERIERLIASLPPGEPLRSALLEVRMAVSELEELTAEARQAIEKLEVIVRKLSAPANRIGTFLTLASPETAQIVVGGSDFLSNADPRVELRSLRRGTRVLVNEAYVIVGDLG